jgi:hypothetical protein
MPVSICPRCKHVNPEYAVYCHFDGVVLQAQQSAAVHRLPMEFTFPSGRRCKSFDELAQGCQEEWAAARDILMRGMFAQFFRTCKRDDLVRAANDAKAQINPDIGLTTFLGALPGTRTATPKVDLHPRRILLGQVTVGEIKSVPLTITNAGQGMLQGTITITEGQDWLSLSESKAVHEVEVNAAREQTVKLTLNTKGVAAGQSYGAALTVVTNGGVVEVPLRMELVAQPFAKAPFQGVRTQRELAERMRGQPKAAGPVLESGDVQRWFAHNGWTYPVSGGLVKGVAGVQQFFEGMGVSKPPPVQLSKNEIQLTCKYRDTTRAEVTLKTPAKKWVYAHITSDSPWLKVMTPQVAGPQQVSVAFEVDTNLWNAGPRSEGRLTLEANGGQKLTLKVTVEVQGSPAIQKIKPPVSTPTRSPESPVHAAPPAAIAPGLPPDFPKAGGARAPDPMQYREFSAGKLKFIPALVTTILLCLILRVILIPLVDMVGRQSVAAATAEKLGSKPEADSPFAAFGGWLQLPWVPILGGADEEFSTKVFQPGTNAQLKTLEFRDYFTGHFIRWFMLRTWWLGAVIGAFSVLRRGGGALDIPWGIVAGSVAGLIFSGTIAAFFLVAEMMPHILWHFSIGAHGGFGFLILWVMLAIFCWLLIGILMGFVLPWITPVRRALIDPLQSMIAMGFGIVGMKAVSAYWSP